MCAGTNLGHLQKGPEPEPAPEAETEAGPQSEPGQTIYFAAIARLADN